MKQTAFVYGTSNNLVGVYTEPASAPPRRDVAFLIWNTGLSGRIGHFRGHVEICRMVARIGFPIFRFDLSSRGDSEDCNLLLPEQERNTGDVVASMDLLSQHYGCRKFILIGICSGAIDAHHVAIRDDRVLGFAMIDTYAYPNSRFYFHYYLKRLSISRMIYAVTRRLRRGSAQKDAAETSFRDDYPPLAESISAWHDFMRRGIQALVVFTGGFGDIYSYREQFIDLLADVNFRGQLSLIRLNKADHIFSLTEERYSFHEVLREWIQTHFAGFLASPQATDPPAALPLGQREALAPAGACLGRDEQGLPAWFFPDPGRASKWLKLAQPDATPDTGSAQGSKRNLVYIAPGRDEAGSPGWYSQGEGPNRPHLKVDLCRLLSQEAQR